MQLGGLLLKITCNLTNILLGSYLRSASKISNRVLLLSQTDSCLGRWRQTCSYRSQYKEALVKATPTAFYIGGIVPYIKFQFMQFLTPRDGISRQSRCLLNDCLRDGTRREALFPRKHWEAR